MPSFLPWRHAVLAVALSLAGASATGASDKAAPSRSALDAQLFYQLLIGEIELRSGEHGNAYRAFLEAARRTRDPLLFRRAMDVALQARAGDDALVATHAWRSAWPDSPEPLRLQLQILAAMNRLDQAADPVASLLSLTPTEERPALITALPRLFERAADKRRAAEMLEQALQPLIGSTPAESTAAQVTMGRAWLAAGEPAKALELARAASQGDALSASPAALAIELVTQLPQAEELVLERLQRQPPAAGLRMAWVRSLIAGQRFQEAVAQLGQVVDADPNDAAAHLTLGALRLELRQLEAAEQALARFLDLTAEPAAATPAETAASAASAGAGDHAAARQTETQRRGRVQAQLMLAQAAELRGDLPAAESWLAQIVDPERALDVQARRASLLARQGRVDEAVASLRGVVERSPADARAKLVAEAQLMRDLGRWQQAHDLFAQGVARFDGDIDLMYEQAMMAERIERFELMESLLKRVIELKPDHAHARNALGYSLADRGVRLDEARELIVRALELRPGDPFITDSLGWVEYRAGKLEQAEQALRQAWSTRRDTEIGAHLGEVLWKLGREDEAKAIWDEVGTRDGDNAVLRQTLERLLPGAGK